MRRVVMGAAVAGVLMGGPAAAQQIRAGEVVLEPTGRAHLTFSTTSVEDDDVAGTVPSSTFEARRVRLGMELTIAEWITGMVEVDFAGGGAELRNTWMNLGFSETFELRVGHFKKPFSRLRLTSSATFPTIERAVRIRGLDAALEQTDVLEPGSVLTSFLGEPLLGEEQFLVNELGHAGYDLGAMAHGQLGRFRYAAGVFNGMNADTRDANDGKSYAARVTWAADAAPFEIGAAVSRREIGDPQIDGTAFEVDAEWGEFRRPGLHALVELATGNTIGTDGARFVGAQAVLSLYRPLDDDRLEGWSFVGRVSWGDPNDDEDDDAAFLLTPGINFHFFGRNMLLLNWDVYVPQGGRFDTHHALQAQARLYF